MYLIYTLILKYIYIYIFNIIINTVNYIKYRLKSIFDEEVVYMEYMEHLIAMDLNKKYKLKNPALHEQCLINTLGKLNKLLSVENNEYMNNTEDNYTLTLDNNYFNESIFIDENEKILPIRIKKTDKIINKDTHMINITDIIKNNYYGYILYEVIDGYM